MLDLFKILQLSNSEISAVVNQLGKVVENREESYSFSVIENSVSLLGHFGYNSRSQVKFIIKWAMRSSDGDGSEVSPQLRAIRALSQIGAPEEDLSNYFTSQFVGLVDHKTSGAAAWALGRLGAKASNVNISNNILSFLSNALDDPRYKSVYDSIMLGIGEYGTLVDVDTVKKIENTLLDPSREHSHHRARSVLCMIGKDSLLAVKYFYNCALDGSKYSDRNRQADVRHIAAFARGSRERGHSISALISLVENTEIEDSILKTVFLGLTEIENDELRYECLSELYSDGLLNRLKLDNNILTSEISAKPDNLLREAIDELKTVLLNRVDLLLASYSKEYLADLISYKFGHICNLAAKREGGFFDIYEEIYEATRAGVDLQTPHAQNDFEGILKDIHVARLFQENCGDM